MFDNLEIRVLICKRDVERCLIMIKSLTKYDEFKNIPIYFHDDGSLDDISKHTLLSVKKSYIVDKTYADNVILEFINKYKNSKKYRFEPIRVFNPTKMKLFDFYFLSNTKNILCIDSDILFMNKPETIIELINKSTPFYSPDYQNAYSFCKSSKINVPEKVNVGIFYIPSEEYYNIDSIEFALNDLFTIGFINAYWIEQSAWSHMFYKNGKYIKLNEKKYQIPNPYDSVPENIEALHLTAYPEISNLYYDFFKNTISN
jgi:hypothetical protein